MSVSAAQVSVSAPGFGRHAWWILLPAALALLWVATARRIARVEALTDRPNWSVDAPARDAASPTGHELGQRRLIVPGHHDPSFWWIMETQLAAAEGRWRLRRISYDAPPGEHREALRTSPYRWWLAGVGRLQRAFTGDPPGLAIERGALWADPLLLALLLAGGALYSARYIGPPGAAALVLGGIALFPLAANFQPGAPDPRSLAWVLAAAGLLPLLAATPRRGHYAAAGLAGGIGFWNDAASQTAVLLALGAGALAAGMLRPPSAVPARPWRTWAAAGALTTLAASLVEFGPDQFGRTPEAVHPVQALGWWGLGEILVAAGRWRREGWSFAGRLRVAWLGAAVLAFAAWPVSALMGGSGWLLAGDFHARELANHPHGGIAANLGAWLDRAGGGAVFALLLPAGLLVVLGWRCLTGRKTGEDQGPLVLVLVGAAFVAVLGCLQLRWWNLVDVFLLAGLARLWSTDAATAGRIPAGSLAAALLVLPGLPVGLATGARDEPSPPEAQALIARDFAHALVRRQGGARIVLYSTPVMSGAAAFYGGFRVVATSDSTNRPGHEAAMRIASASTEQELAVLLQTRGITHVALPSWDPVLDQLARIGLGVPADQALPRAAFTVALREWDMPLSMRPMDCLIPNEPGFQDHELRAFAVAEGQEPDLALARLADFFVDRGQLGEARAVRDSLQAYPRSVAAVAAVAGVDFALRDGIRLQQTLKALVPMLGRRTARDLPPDRRISLATLLLRTRQPERAREQLTIALAGLDAPTVRTFPPGLLVNLVGTTRSLGLAFPHPELEALALALIPPRVRAGLVGR